MSLWAYTSILLCSLIIVRSIQNLYNLRISLKWLDVRQRSRSDDKNTKFYVCIPALYEQDTIIRTLEKFICQTYPSDLISIYVATSAKESPVDGKPTTREVVDTYIASRDEHDQKRIHVLHYTKQNGYMAHQINFVATKLRTNLMRDNTYFVVYNADSHIDKNTFSLAAHVIARELKLGRKYPTILQQSAVYQYTGNSYSAEGAGLHQTLWTLVHEMPKLRKQSSMVRKLQGDSFIQSIRYGRIAHCVGHGLFVRGDYYVNHPLPQDILNEDLPYGLQACALRESIFPIPSLELASTPNKLANVYLQKSTWFNPFFEFTGYSRNLIHQGLYISKFEVLWLTAQAYGGLMIWLVHSFVLTGGLLVSIAAGWVYVLAWIIALLLYWVVPALIMTHKRSGLVNGGNNSYLSIVAGTLYVLTHSVGPLISVYRWLIASARGTKPSKRKTESA